MKSKTGRFADLEPNAIYVYENGAYNLNLMKVKMQNRKLRMNKSLEDKIVSLYEHKKSKILV